MDVTRDLRALLLLFVFLTLNKHSVNAFFEGCDNNFNLYIGHRYELPTTKPSCRIKYTAPKDHNIVVTCNIDIPKVANNDGFYVATNADKTLSRSKRVPNKGRFTRTSLNRSMVLAYISSSAKRYIQCTLAVERNYCGLSITKQIAGGKETARNEYPSSVALKTDNILFCSATIISSRFLVTAAHCVSNREVKAIEAWVGQHNIQTDNYSALLYRISKKFIPTSHQPNTYINDIALLQTTRNIKFSRNVSPICLPPYSMWGRDFSSHNVDLIGWGTTIFAGPPSETLQKVTVTTTDNLTCKRHYGNEAVHPTHICTRDNAKGSRKDSCQYDSGGPVVFKKNGRQYIFGIIVYGKGCAAEDNPIGINTRLTSFMPWINQVTGHTIGSIDMQL